MKTRTGTLILLTALLLASAACSKKGPQPEKKAPAAATPAPAGKDAGSTGAAARASDQDALTSESPPEHVAMTFNAGLARNYIAFVEERLAAIVAELNASEAEVICLQEVWEDADAATIVEGVKGRYPHSYLVTTEADGTGTGSACTSAALKPLGDCVAARCKDAADTTGCVMSKCGVLFLGLTGGCRACLAAHVSQPLEQILATCTSAGAGRWSYGGRNGLLLLSKRPFVETSHQVLDSFLLRRAVLMGTVKMRGGPVPFFCTHLSTPVDEVEYAGSASSWTDEQAKQIDRLISLVKEKAGRNPAIVLGDFNCGPANQEWDVIAENPDNYQRLVSAGLASPYAEEHGHCTWCYGKALKREPDRKGKMLDHIFFFNFASEIITVARVMDETTVEVEDATSKREVPLSDHYGVQTEFTVPFMQ